MIYYLSSIIYYLSSITDHSIGNSPIHQVIPHQNQVFLRKFSPPVIKIIPQIKIAGYLCCISMKKILASFAVFIYFAFVTGIMVNYHFCMNRLDSFQLYKSADENCNSCGMPTENKGCCHDEITIIKVDDDHKTSSFSFGLKSLEPSIAELPDFIALELNKPVSIDQDDHSPPLKGPPGIYIQNRVFRI
jgi:hypothetical protein